MEISVFFINWKSNFDVDLKRHIDSPTKNKYLSPKVQNEIIDCCGEEVRENIVPRMSNSSFFSIMADETTDDSNQSLENVCLYKIFGSKRTEGRCS